MRAKFNRAFEYLSIITSFIMLAAFLFIFVFSVLYWDKYIWITNSLSKNYEDMAYQLAILIVIVTVMAEWIDGRMKAIIKSFDNLKKLKGGTDGIEIHKGESQN